MSEIIGRDIECGLSIEQTRGTPQAVAEKWFKHVNCNIIEKAQHAIDDNSHGVLEDSDNRRVVKKWIEGSLEGVLHVDAIGYLFYALLGACSSSWVASGVYDHEITVAQNIQHPSLAVFVKDGGIQQSVFGNGMIGDLELKASIDDYLRFTANFLAASQASNTDTPSYDTEYDFIAKDIVIKVAASEAGLSGATAIKAKDLSIKLDQGLIQDHVVGGYFPDDIYNGKIAIEGSFTKNFDAETFKDLFLGDTAQYMSITITGEADIGGTHYPTITILLNKVKIMEWERSGGNDELVVENISFKAFYRDTDSQMVQISLRNNTAEYASAPSA